MSDGGIAARELSAVTLLVSDMSRSVAFYTGLGFEIRYGGADAPFTSFSVGAGYLNLASASPPDDLRWGRFIVYVADVDAHHGRVLEMGYTPEAAPRDAEWGERYFHVRDPDGHEVSFARPLDR